MSHSRKVVSARAMLHVGLVATLAAALLLAAAPASAQVVRLRIVIQDDGGNPVEGLTLRMVPTDLTGHERAATSNKKGQLTIPNLDGAPYKPELGSQDWVIKAVTYKARSSDNALLPEFTEADAVANGVPIITFEPYSRGDMEIVVTRASNVRRAGLAALPVTVEELKELNAMLTSGDWDGILEHAPHVIAANPDLAGGHYIYGVGLWKSGRFEEAATELDKALELDPEQEGIDSVQAALYLEHARALAPTDPQAAMPLAEKAAVLLQEHINRAPDSKNDMINLYSAQELAGRKEDSMATLGRLIEMWPDDPNPYLRLADLQIEAGRVDDAVATLERMPGESTKVIDLLYNAAVVKYNQDNFDAAVATVDRAIAIAPEMPMLYQLKGRALAAAGRMPEALTAFKDYIRLSPPDADVEVEKQLVEALEKQEG